MPEVEFSSGSSEAEEELADYSVPEEQPSAAVQEESEDDSDTHTSEECDRPRGGDEGGKADSRAPLKRSRAGGATVRETSAEPKKRRKLSDKRSRQVLGAEEGQDHRSRKSRRGDTTAIPPPWASDPGLPGMPPVDGLPEAFPWMPPGSSPSQPMLPMLHSIMKGRVQFMTGRGAFLKLSDGGPARYVDGLLQRRSDGPKLEIGDSVFVKVARLEAGMVIVDHRHVDSETGRDLDPFNENAEVEAWVDVPMPLVGRIIGRNGAQIRQICEKSGASLRFDDAAPSNKQGRRSDEPKAERQAQGGVGSDLAKFLDEARAGEDGDGSLAEAVVKNEVEAKDPAADGDDLRAFLEDAREGEDAAVAETRFEVEDKFVEFTATDLQSWETTLHREMEAAGVSEMYMERLTIRDHKGRLIDLTKGFHAKQFPISVQYVIPAVKVELQSEEEDSDKENLRVPGVRNVEEVSEKKSSFTAKAAEEAFLKRLADGEVEMEPRPDAISITGADKLTRKHIQEILKAKDLPDLIGFKHVGKSEVLCIFSSEDEAADALEGLLEGFESVPFDKGSGPGLWRACNGYLKFKQAEQPKAPLRPEALVVEGVEGLEPRHLNELLRVKGLPSCSGIELIDSGSTAVCIFATEDDVRAVLQGVAEGFEDASQDAGPGVFRAKSGRLSFRTATLADSDQGYQARHARRKASAKVSTKSSLLAMQRLRINGDAADVAKAEALVRQWLEEQSSGPGAEKSGQRAPMRLREGEVRKRLPVPAELVGRLIGKGGESIKRLESDSGARLQVVATEDGDELQELLIQGLPDAVAKAEELAAPILESSRSKAVAKRKEVRDKGPDDSLEQATPRGEEEMQEMLQHKQTSVRSAQQQEAASAEAANEAEDATVDSDDERRLQRKLHKKEEERQKTLVMKAAKVILQKQWRLEKAASLAEDLAQAASTYAEQVKEERQQRELAERRLMEGAGEAVDVEEDDAAGKSFCDDWTEDPESAMLERPVATPCGHGRVSRVLTTRRGGVRYITVQCFSGMTVQAPEKSAQKWLTNLDSWMGECVVPPKPPVGGGSAAQPLPSATRALWTQGGPHINGLAVDNLVRRGSKLAFRLLRANGMLGASVPADELKGWTRIDTRVYLIELCATPRNTKHFVPCRHDYRAAREPYDVGDLVVLESTKASTLDIGVVRKVLVGDKADKVAGAAVSPAVAAESAAGAVTALRRVLRLCTADEKQRREGALKGLEAAALPLLQDRLPQGVEALGVGANLDGSRLRLFVRVHSGGRAMPGGADARIVPATHTERATAAAAAALGALLGCETEVLSERAPPPEPEKQPKEKVVAEKGVPQEPEKQPQEQEKPASEACATEPQEVAADESSGLQQGLHADGESQQKSEPPPLAPVKLEPEGMSKKDKKKSKKRAKKEAKAAKKAAKKVKKRAKKQKAREKGEDGDDSSSSSSSSSS